MKQFLLLCFGLLLSASALAQSSVPEGEAIIRQMHDEYHNAWYDHLTFEQETIFYKEGKVARRQMWYEALSVPGRLAIKFDSLRSGTGIIFKQDSQYVFQENKLVQQTPRVHELLVLGFDVYGRPPAETIKQLQDLGFDLSKRYETQWQGRPTYVIGAENKQATGNQFWIDKERLYFVRLLKSDSNSGSTEEVQFNKYEKAGQGWVAPEVLFYRNGELVLKEIYSNIQVREQLESTIFDLENFQQARW